MVYRIAVISGDGIGPEIVREAKKVLDCIGKKYGHEFQYTEVLMGVSVEAMNVHYAEIYQHHIVTRYENILKNTEY